MAKKHNFQEGSAEVKPVTVFGKNSILTEKEDIEYYMNWVREIRIQNQLIGNISTNGTYQIPEKLRRELVKMEKEAVDLSRSYYIALSVFMKKTFNFAVEVEVLEDGRASASLFLNEVVQDVEGVSSLRTFIAKTIEPFDGQFESVVCAKFHIVDTPKSIQETDIPEITLELQGQLDEWLYTEEIDDIGSQIYVMRLLKELQSAGPVGQKIVADYKAAILKNKVDEKAKGIHIKLRRLLDEIIEKNGGLDQLPISKEVLLQPKKEFNVTMRKVQAAKQAASPVAANEVNGKIAGKAATGAAKSAGAVKAAAKPAKGKQAGKKPVKAKKKAAKADKGGGKAKKDKKESVSYPGGKVYTAEDFISSKKIKLEEEPLIIAESKRAELKNKEKSKVKESMKVENVLSDLNILRGRGANKNNESNENNDLVKSLLDDMNKVRTENAMQKQKENAVQKQKQQTDAEME